jgi:metal-responsive CopG/Arc/MetJ family transcriptional regulator
VKLQARRKGRGAVTAASVATRRVPVEFSARLLAETEDAAAALSMNRSNFIRAAVERYIEQVRQRRIEQELAAAYTANSELDRKLCREFEYVDAEPL